uniref:Uncharacterized protein n=1 Tax=Ditylenchus dipsaci TaxID=166011 RepID=A0A915DC35_9BILA
MHHFSENPILSNTKSSKWIIQQKEKQAKNKEVNEPLKPFSTPYNLRSLSRSSSSTVAGKKAVNEVPPLHFSKPRARIAVSAASASAMKPEDKRTDFLTVTPILRKGSVKQMPPSRDKKPVEGSSRKPVFQRDKEGSCYWSSSCSSEQVKAGMCINSSSFDKTEDAAKAKKEVMQLKKDTKESRHSIELVVGKEEDIFWTPAKEFLKSECEKEEDPPQSRVSSIIHGCIDTLSSFVPMCIRKSPEKVSLQASRRRSNCNKDRTVVDSMISTFIGIPSDLRLESISSYSFKVPDFVAGDSAQNGDDLRNLVNSVLSVLKSHLEKAGILLEKEKFLPDEVAEIVRVAYGHTDLLLRKRVAQFSKQLESYMMPAADAKLTTLNDLVALWGLVDAQLDDIRKCFEQVDKCRLAGWQVPKQTRSSTPSLLSSSVPNEAGSSRFVSSQPPGIKINPENNEREKQRKAALEAKRKEMDEKRRAMIQAKRIEMQRAKEEQKAEV